MLLGGTSAKAIECLIAEAGPTFYTVDRGWVARARLPESAWLCQTRVVDVTDAQHL